MKNIELIQTCDELDQLIDEEKKYLKFNAITCVCFAFATGGELTMSLFHPEIANFIITGGFAVFSGLNAKWVYDHYTKQKKLEDIKNKQYTKTK